MAFADITDVAIAMIQGQRLPLQKAAIASQVAGSEASLWRGTGYPAQGAIPGAAAICNSALLGALPLAPRSGAQERALLLLVAQMAVAGHTLYVEDRLGHMGGLSGTVTTAQTVNLDISGAGDNLVERVGAANYSEVEWYLEWYTATGATIATPTINVTYGDNTTSATNVWVLGATALPASVGASRRYKISPTNGKFIKSVQSVQLSVSTGTAGSFGVTAVRRLAEFECTIANVMQVRDWSQITLPKIADSACITFSQLCAGTSTGATSGHIKQGSR